MSGNITYEQYVDKLDKLTRFKQKLIKRKYELLSRWLNADNPTEVYELGLRWNKVFWELKKVNKRIVLLQNQAKITVVD